ncbi:uncharacterized protein N7483_005738 [Penicillium malachiteum]|uniref:uncharacterized protein n=1 Tax=Penicillium malachiteum TaxID=1324776 RepID=UPI00254961FE|nr:uncharacterized protein N7483_005738 [Penicillium malachiteum]KAJ5731230.1 hypothetical protein N7483_005738 [Penicillium malachiteum]
MHCTATPYNDPYLYPVWSTPTPNVYLLLSRIPLSSDMEAVIFFTAVTFMVAVGSAVVQGVIFWKRYRIRFHVTNKTPSISSRDLENQDPGLNPLVAAPAPLLHTRAESLGVRRWPSTYYDQTRWTGIAQSVPSIPVDRRHLSNPFVPFQGVPGGPTLEEISERSPTPATISHLTTATGSRDQQGYAEPKP